MSTPTTHHLRIADTPADDETSLPAAAKDADSDVSSGPGSPEVIASTLPASPTSPRLSALSSSRTDGKRRGRRGGSQRLPMDQIDDEIHRVDCMNHGITLARGTDPAD